MPSSSPDDTVRLFLSYARDDFESVSALYDQLEALGLRPWMDKRDLLPGQRWRDVIAREVKQCDLVLICLSPRSVDKRGSYQREIRAALDVWQEKRQDDIYLIPVRLAACEVPQELGEFNPVDLYDQDGWKLLLRAIEAAAKSLDRPIPAELTEALARKKEASPSGLTVEPAKVTRRISAVNSSSPDSLIITDPIRLELVRVEAGEFLMGTRSIDIEDLFGLYRGKRNEYEWETEQYLLALPEFYIATTMVTVEQFDVFVKADNYKTEAEERNWGLVRKDDQWKKTDGASWRHPRGPVTHTSHKSRHPVTQVSFHDVVKFCKWLQGAVDSGLQSHLGAGRWELRIPTEAEWEKAARGPDGRVFPWGNQAPDDNRCNYGMLVKDTTEVDQYPGGRSPYCVFDMAGNVWEWTATLWDSEVKQPPYRYPYNPDDNREDPSRVGPRVMRGGSYHDNAWIIRSAFRHRRIQSDSIDCGSFRVCVVRRETPASRS